jgi:tRNA (guanine-N7-)-methyltransferase
MTTALAPESLLVRPGRELAGPGGWDAVFGRRAPLQVEVGFGRDEGLLRRAKRSPERDFLGIELKRERVETYLGRAARAGLRNVRVAPGRAEVVLGILLPDARAAAIRVEFPDPWPKDRHAHHRLVQPHFVREARRVLEPGGALVMATDDAPYQEQMRTVVASAGGFEGGEVDPERERSLADGTTIFERKGLQRGATIRWFLWRRLP